ncbi:MAG: chemotaxis protein CheA [Deferrisomatales bacterium]
MSGTDVSRALAGYFDETSELLGRAEKALLAVEGSVQEGDLDVPALYEAFRALHTVKGLSAMVEADKAVGLSHAMESVLEGLHRAEAAPGRDLLDVLFAGLARLRALVEELRHPESAAVEVDDLIGSLEAAAAGPLAKTKGGGPAAELPLPHDLSERLTGYERRRLARRLAAGEGLYLLELVPDQEKVARGVTINAIREALEGRKELVTAVPATDPHRGLWFRIAVVSARPLDQVVEPWAGDVTGEVLREPRPVRGKGPGEASTEVRPGPAPRPAAGDEVIRVPVAKLDEMLRLVGDLVLDKNRLQGLAARMGDDLPPRRLRQWLQEALRGLDRSVRELRHQVTAARLVPVAELLDRAPLIVREASRVHGKEVRVAVSGAAAEVDKAVVDRLSEPLVHLLRNAVDHGVETPEERRAAGKEPLGRVEIAARVEGEEIALRIADDGRGIDGEAVRRRAETLGLHPAGRPWTRMDLIRALCAPGFTTRERADLLGGRGVGMETVHRAVGALGGRLELETRPGQGTAWTLRLPLTLTILDVVIVAVGGERYALPLAAVREIVEAPALVRVDGGEILRHRDREIPHFPLARLLGTPPAAGGEFPAAVIVEGASEPVALGVGRLLGLREVVVRPLADPLCRAPGAHAVTDLGDGRGVLVLDPREVVELGVRAAG